MIAERRRSGLERLRLSNPLSWAPATTAAGAATFSVRGRLVSSPSRSNPDRREGIKKTDGPHAIARSAIQAETLRREPHPPKIMMVPCFRSFWLPPGHDLAGDIIIKNRTWLIASYFLLLAPFHSVAFSLSTSSILGPILLACASYSVNPPLALCPEIIS